LKLVVSDLNDIAFAGSHEEVKSGGENRRKDGWMERGKKGEDEKRSLREAWNS
jgi:hypothetical protein